MLDSFRPYRQRDTFDCAVPLAQGVLRLLRKERRSYRAVLEGLKPSEVDGTHPAALELFFRREGLRVLAGEMEVGDLQYMTKIGRPVLCLITSGMVGHWVAVVGVSRGKVSYHDPEVGASVMRAEDWESSWWDYDRRTELPHFAMAIHA